ncbi:histidine kinase [Streptomyces sp. TRM 70351]|uniref:histidine kinase n=1 Tax=Streptomyces sp. TRM 70351 TaxID=3116552 RepID=UPI002E7ADD93|nr:histidine kinase [Streptomyces sp. TRM 70351]MEE1930674.1 histidine kinase [Streptomyces sp. TRM 70351]
MLDPQVTVTALLGAGFVATSAGLVVQTRSKRALAVRGAWAEQQRDAAEQQRDAAAAHGAALEREVRHFAEGTMPALVDVLARGYRGVPVPGLGQEQLAGTAVDLAHQAVRRMLQEAVSVTREQIGRAARSSVRDIIDEAQTRLHRCQMSVLQEMERHPDGTAYHQSLMNFDHLVTQALHTLQRTRILTGSWPGLQRADCTVREVVESARGRISDYLRVSYTYEPGTGETWLEGRVVEPVTVALTELLSNATAYSSGKVYVEVQVVQTGLCFFIDDGGLNMNAFQREEATRQLAQREVLDVTNVQDSGQLGFAVIGRLAGEYGFVADVTSTSPLGGLRAVLRVPRALFGHGPSDEEIQAERHAAMALTTQAPLTPASLSPAGDGRTPPAETTGPAGLPQRRRRAARTAEPARDGAPAPADDPDAFSAGLAHLGRTIHDTETHTLEGDQPHA